MVDGESGAMNQCDFCSLPHRVEWVYYCQPFDVNAIAFSEKGVDGPVIVLDSVGDDMMRWGACHDCSLYIDRQDYFFLAQRITRQQDSPNLFGPILSLFHEFQRMRLPVEKQLVL